MLFDFYVNLNCQTGTTTLSLGINILSVI